MMERMQQKLEQIESKLNYFIESSPKKLASERNSLHILYSEESRLLTKQKQPFVVAKSFKKSLRCTEQNSIASNNPITDRIEISGSGMASECKNYIIIFVDYPKSTTHKNQPSESADTSGPSDRHAGTVRNIYFCLSFIYFCFDLTSSSVKVIFHVDI
jgi:hypothetical protein